VKLDDLILNFAKQTKKFRTSDLLQAVKGKYSTVWIARTLSKLADNGALIKAGSGPRVYYSLPENEALLYQKIKRRLKNENLKEHEVLQSLLREGLFFKKIRDNVRSIFDYAFSEMLNNAIEHSKSKYIDIEVAKMDDFLSFTVRDYGIGVFRNIMQKRGLKDELEAIQDVLKGKVTTAPKAHSGEGIFFTSKVADVFSEESYDYKLLIDNLIDDIFVEEIKNVRGTKVTFKIRLDCKRHLNDVFKEYQAEPDSYAFDKTEIQIRLYQMGTIHISRSQARRVLSGLDKFRKVILDFAKVPTVGQAFADEIFRVFALKHPGIEIIPINMNDTVKFMIGRVERPDLDSKVD